MRCKFIPNRFLCNNKQYINKAQNLFVFECPSLCNAFIFVTGLPTLIWICDSIPSSALDCFKQVVLHLICGVQMLLAYLHLYLFKFQRMNQKIFFAIVLVLYMTLYCNCYRYFVWMFICFLPCIYMLFWILNMKNIYIVLFIEDLRNFIKSFKKSCHCHFQNAVYGNRNDWYEFSRCENNEIYRIWIV